MQRLHSIRDFGQTESISAKSVVFAADLPETVGGKVLKSEHAEHAGHYSDVDP
jgi:hypothetical protein